MGRSARPQSAVIAALAGAIVSFLQKRGQESA